MKKDNNRFLFPNEWKEFLKSIKDRRSQNTKVLYELQFQTGGRFNELIHVRPRDFDFDRGTLMLWKTKTKARKGEKVGKPRMISLGSDFNRKMIKFVRDKPYDEYLFKISQSGYNQLFKSKLKKINVKNPQDFSSHNLRKTHGMYLKAMGVDIAEICTRLGHDYNTYIKHYGSPSVFTESDMREIKSLMGDLIDRLRRRF